MVVKLQDITFVALRLLLGVVFIFSGFVKSADPVGTSIFVEKYLATYSMEWLMPLSLHVAVALGVVELALGVMLVLKKMLRYVLLATILILTLFTILTLLNATILPIGDCGCFGDAVKLTPWQTLLKNVVMLPAALWLYRKTMPRKVVKGDIVALVAAALVALGINIYAIRHLPLIDFMPYKVGLDLGSAVAAERTTERESVRSVLIFRNVSTGEICEFAGDDVDCWMDDDLEYVDARVQSESVPRMTFSDFRIFNAEGVECGLELLQMKGRYAWLFIRGAEELYGGRMCAIEYLREQYPDEYIVAVTSDAQDDVERLIGMPCYAMDAMTMRSVMRADVGVVIIEDGVIIDKRSFRDI